MIRERLRRLGSGAEYARLDAALTVMHAELDELRAGRDEPWARAVKDLLDRAVAEREAGRREVAWALVQASRRRLLAGYDEERLAAHVRALRAEASRKLDSWRRDAVAELLDETAAPARLPAVHLATLIRDEAAANGWWRVAFLRRRLLVLGLMLAATLVALLVVAIAWPVGLGSEPPGAGWRIWIYAALFGALGGCLSAARSLSRSATATRIPKDAESWAVTVFRPVAGAAGGVAALVLLGNDLQTVGPMLALAFAAGFSEQFVARAVESRPGGLAPEAEAERREVDPAGAQASRSTS